MKKVTGILFLSVVSVFLLFGFRKKMNTSSDKDEIWSGTVSFVQKQTGAMIVTSEWKMEATIISNKANAVHSFHSKLITGDISDCKTTSETELGVGIDYDGKVYTIEVPMPGCYGKQTSGDRSIDFSQSDETAIRINDQPLKDPNVLEGTFTEKEGTEESGGITTTTYTWHLERIGKKYQFPAEKNATTKPGITGKVSTTSSGKINNSTKTNSGNINTSLMNNGNLKDGLWSGYVVFNYTMVDKRDVTEGSSRSQLDAFRDATMFIQVTNNKGVAHVSDDLSSWEKITVTYANGPPAVQIKKINESGSGSGDVAVWVEMNRETGKYWLKTDGPSYTVSRVDSFIQTTLGATIIQSGDKYTAEQPGFPIDAPDQPIGLNPNEAKGRYVIMHNRTHYLVVSWDLKKSTSQTKGNSNSNTNSNPNSSPNLGSITGSNSGQNSGSNQNNQQCDSVELIVTPENYYNWLPKADGRLKVSLEVRCKGRLQSISKAVSFELALFSTSIGGSTSTAVSGLADLRFHPQTNAVLSNQDQFMTMPCADGKTGEFFIDSYNQLASTTLVAVTILSDGRRIKGNLLRSGGPIEIPIPKTNPQ